MHQKKDSICILHQCKFPRTCQWNKVCIEKKLQLSLTSKKVKAIEVTSDKKSKLTDDQNKVFRKPTG